MSMTLKPSSRLSNLVQTLSRRRLPHAPRRMHQAVARSPLTRIDCSSSSQTARLGAPSQNVDTLLAEYANQGNIQDFELLVSRMVSGTSLFFFEVAAFITTFSAPPTEHQQDLHIKAYIAHDSLPARSNSRYTQQFPTGALAVLHRYEASGHFAPIKSYTRVISALLNVQTCPNSSDPWLGRAAAQAQAWDLFAHMRYVAHRVPDAHLYSLMIRACESFSRPEPERALDLWMEMQENEIKPTKGAYEAIIRVCGRAGPEWLGEGMRLAREMSDQYSITGMDGRGLWCALLEGCKRAGDLKKARWILVEAVRGSDDGVSRKDSMVDAELMTHIFHTYASYKPPFRRETTRLVDCSAVSNGDVSTNESREEEMSSHSEPLSRVSTEHTREGDIFPGVPVENVENTPPFSRLPPQTSSDVIAETRALFNWILQDRSLSLEKAGHSLQGGLPVGRFAHVKMTPALLNAYLSVFYRHASIEASWEAFKSLFDDSPDGQALYPDEYSYVNALERCAIACAEDRHIAARWAESIWGCWEATEAEGLRDGKGNVGSFARLVEKAHTAMRRVLIL